MKRGKIIILLLTSILLLSFISAYMSPIKIKTIPGDEVQITAYDSAAANFVKLDGIIGIADTYGDFYWNFSTNKEKFSLIVFIKKDGEKIANDQFEDYKSGESVYIELAPDWFKFIETPKLESEINETNSTLSNITTTENITQEIKEINNPDASITGKVTNPFAEGGLLRKAWIYYTLGGIVLLAIVWFVIRIILKHRSIEKIPKEIRIKKLSELKQEQVQQRQENDELKAAEEELRLAQEKISTIKNKERIDELRQEIEGKEQELRRLRGDNN